MVWRSGMVIACSTPAAVRGSSSLAGRAGCSGLVNGVHPDVAALEDAVWSLGRLGLPGLSVELGASSVTDLPVTPESFDAAWCLGVLAYPPVCANWCAWCGPLVGWWWSAATSPARPGCRSSPTWSSPFGGVCMPPLTPARGRGRPSHRSSSVCWPPRCRWLASSRGHWSGSAPRRGAPRPRRRRVPTPAQRSACRADEQRGDHHGLMGPGARPRLRLSHACGLANMRG